MILETGIKVFNAGFRSLFYCNFSDLATGSLDSQPCVTFCMEVPESFTLATMFLVFFGSSLEMANLARPAGLFLPPISRATTGLWATD